MATTAHELDEMTNVDLEAKLREAKEELFNLRFQAATGQLESHGRLRTVKKDIARIYTVVRERELGIRTAPGSSNERGWCRMSEQTADSNASATRARSARASWSATRWTRPWSCPSRTASSTPSTARSCAAPAAEGARRDQRVRHRRPGPDHGDPSAVGHQALARRPGPREGEVIAPAGLSPRTTNHQFGQARRPRGARTSSTTRRNR